MSASEEELVGHSYTRARKHPLVIGKLPGAGRLPGGPYTITQIVTMVVVFAALTLTQSLWAHFGVGNVAIMIAFPWGLAWVLRYARIDGRDPARALRSLLVYTSTPADGRLAGRPQHTPRARLVRGHCTVRILTPADVAPVPQKAPSTRVAPAALPTSAQPARRPQPVPAAAAVSAPADRPHVAPRTQLEELLASLDARRSAQ
ncbi:hypothetical protein [Streptomyces lunaelactis]|uniref:hypothetical protein n=1 Tax=Streptomyces lunaelactis TaxID=1535768 RepID=UPI001584FB5A|nr:hypothetical protein [Streptomyces lunaelactis]NUK15801.1 hypothetical protein [Streptomyces lunaelactis]